MIIIDEGFEVAQRYTILKNQHSKSAHIPMKSPTILFKLCAACSAISGLCLTIGWTLNISRDSMVGAILVLIAYVLALFAYMGIYGIQYEKTTFLGFLGFMLLIMANALFVPWAFLDIARISGVAQVDWREAQETGITHVIGVFGGVGFVFGFLLLGFDSIRARVFSIWPAILLMVAGIMPLIYTWLPIGKLLPRIGGLALLGFGVNLWLLAVKRKSVGEN